MPHPIHPIAIQSVAIGAVSVAAAPFNHNTREVQLTASGHCWVRIDATSIAAVANTAPAFYVPKDSPGLRVDVKPGYILNVIDSGAAGYLSIIEGL